MRTLGTISTRIIPLQSIGDVLGKNDPLTTIREIRVGIKTSSFTRQLGFPESTDTTETIYFIPDIRDISTMSIVFS